MRKLRYVVTAGIAAALSLAGVAGAAASTTAAAPPVLSRLAPGGPPATPGDILTSSLTPGTALNFSTNPGGPFGLFCKQSVWGGQLGSNPPAPGTAVIKLLNPFTISSCYDNSPGVTGVSAVTFGVLPATLQVSDTSSTYPIQILPAAGPLTITYTVVTGSTSVTCVFQAAPPVLTGNTGPGGAPWQFTNQPFKLAGGTLPACGTAPTAFLTAQYSPVLDATAGGSNIYVN